MPSLELPDWPPDLQILRRYVVGVFVGGCVVRGDGSRFRRQAHAHTEGSYRGWICYLSAKRLDDTRLAKHEVAHLISGEGHTARFRRVLAILHGGLLPRDERMVPRQSSWWCRRKFHHGMCLGRADGRWASKRCQCWCHKRRNDAE